MPRKHTPPQHDGPSITPTTVSAVRIAARRGTPHIPTFKELSQSAVISTYFPQYTRFAATRAIFESGICLHLPTTLHKQLLAELPSERCWISIDEPEVRTPSFPKMLPLFEFR